MPRFAISPRLPGGVAALPDGRFAGIIIRPCRRTSRCPAPGSSLPHGPSSPSRRWAGLAARLPPRACPASAEARVPREGPPEAARAWNRRRSERLSSPRTERSRTPRVATSASLGVERERSGCRLRRRAQGLSQPSAGARRADGVRMADSWRRAGSIGPPGDQSDGRSRPAAWRPWTAIAGSCATRGGSAGMRG